MFLSVLYDLLECWWKHEVRSTNECDIQEIGMVMLEWFLVFECGETVRNNPSELPKMQWGGQSYTVPNWRFYGIGFANKYDDPAMSWGLI